MDSQCCWNCGHKSGTLVPYLSHVFRQSASSATEEARVMDAVVTTCVCKLNHAWQLYACDVASQNATKQRTKLSKRQADGGTSSQRASPVCLTQRRRQEGPAAVVKAPEAAPQRRVHPSAAQDRRTAASATQEGHRRQRWCRLRRLRTQSRLVPSQARWR